MNIMHLHFIYENKLIVSIKLNSLHRLHVCMLSVKSIEYFLEKGVNRLAVLFFWHCTRHIRSTDMESFWIGKKRETSPYHPCPNAGFAKRIWILLCLQ